MMGSIPQSNAVEANHISTLSSVLGVPQRRAVGPAGSVEFVEYLLVFHFLTLQIQDFYLERFCPFQGLQPQQYLQ